MKRRNPPSRSRFLFADRDIDRMTGSLNAAERPRIAYFTTAFPVLNETAVIKEMHALQESGIDVDVYTFRLRSFEDRLDPKAQVFRDRSYGPTPLIAAQAAARHAALIAKADRRYLNLLKTVIFESGGGTLAAKNLVAVGFALGVMDDLIRKRIRYVHANFGAYQATAAWAVSMLAGIPFGFSVHAYDIFAVPSLLEHKIDRASLVVSISDFNRRYLRDQLGLPIDNAEVIRCGVDLDEFSIHDRAPAGDGRILAVGRLDVKKGFEVLIDAVGILKSRGHSVPSVTIVGRDPGGRQEALMARIRQNRVEDYVELAGTVTQERLREAYRTADFFVLPCVTDAAGDRDGIPATLMEAMALGLPTISTRVSGIPELVVDGETGLLVEEKDAPALAEAIQRLLDDTSLARRLGAAGRRKVEVEYDSRANALKVGQRIREIIEI